MTWDGTQVRALRAALQLTQQGLAQQLGVRQQTVSEWETGAYAPRGASARLLDIVAERVNLPYGAPDEAGEEAGFASDPPGVACFATRGQANGRGTARSRIRRQATTSVRDEVPS